MMSSGDGAVQVSMFDDLVDVSPPGASAKSTKASANARKAKSEVAAGEGPACSISASKPGNSTRQAKPATPLATDEAFTLENFLPYRILQAAQGLSKRISKTLLDEWDMSLAEWQVLASLARDGAVSVREIEPRTLLDTVAVSRAAKRLTDRKFLKREVNKQDKRLVVLKTTKKGRDIAQAVGHKVMELEGEFLKGMNVQDRIRLSQLLKALS